jgi:hypothetical protein
MLNEKSKISCRELQKGLCRRHHFQLTQKKSLSQVSVKNLSTHVNYYSFNQRELDLP